MIAITVNGLELGATLSTEQLAEMLDTSADTLYLWAKDTNAPLQPIHLGRRLRWRTVDALQLLGLWPPPDVRKPSASVVAPTAMASSVLDGESNGLSVVHGGAA